MTGSEIIDMGNSPAHQEALAEELTTRAIAEIYPNPGALRTELLSGRRLTAYMGIDPTAPDMHVGHESQLLKLQKLQQMGHHVILLIGDFTAMIGDPTDKSAARTKLSREEVLENAEGYKDQASKVLDFEHPANPVELRYNSEWLGGMDFGDVLELASEFTVQQMLERSSFSKRIDEGKPVSLVEFMYPLMQAWDSVALEVDIEVGGSDQIFNMLRGTDLVKRHLSKQKFVIAGQLLVDPDGRKIGKTEGNMITLNDTPLDMFHKIMMWGDNITPHALELCSRMPMDEVRDIEERMRAGVLTGLSAKMLLARTLVTDLHNIDAADKAEAEYKSLTDSRQELDTSLLTVNTISQSTNIVQIITGAGLAKSNAEARRLLSGGAVRINDVKIDESWTFEPTDGDTVLRVGKKKLENHRLLLPTNE